MEENGASTTAPRPTLGRALCQDCHGYPWHCVELWCARTVLQDWRAEEAQMTSGTWIHIAYQALAPCVI